MPTIGPIVREAMQANAALRAYSGFMIFFLAFILRTVHFAGTPDKLALGEMIAAAGIGGFIGTGIGSALRSRAPQAIVFGMLTLATLVTAACAVFFSLWAALVVALAAALGQALVKLALDSILQREIGEEVRSSTFAVSETLHQLSWVAGGLAGLLMSLTNSGVAGLVVRRRRPRPGPGRDRAGPAPPGPARPPGARRGQQPGHLTRPVPRERPGRLRPRCRRPRRAARPRSSWRHGCRGACRGGRCWTRRRAA